MTKHDRNELLTLYADGPRLLSECLSTVPNEAYAFKSGPDRWSIHQIVIHIVDSDINSFMRFRRPVAEPGGSVAVYDEERWASQLHPEALPREIALSLFKHYRNYNTAYFSAVEEGEWDLEFKHPERGTMKLTDALSLYANHPLWHIDHIHRTLGAWKRFVRGETIDPEESYWIPPGQ